MQVKLQGGRIVEVTVKAIVDTAEGVRLQVSFGDAGHPRLHPGSPRQATTFADGRSARSRKHRQATAARTAINFAGFARDSANVDFTA